MDGMKSKPGMNGLNSAGNQLYYTVVENIMATMKIMMNYVSLA